MKSKLNAITMLCLFMVSLFAGGAMATQQGDLPIEDSGTPLRIIDGGLCQDMPDDKGTPSSLDDYGRVWCLGPSGVTDDMTGCVAQFFDASGTKLREDVLEPGEYTKPAPYDTAYWQRFNCYEVKYTCDLFESAGCGSYGEYAKCQADEMLRVRECSANAPDSVETERCIYDASCYNENLLTCDFEIGEWGSCKNGEQSRIITEADCTTWKDYQDCVEVVPDLPTLEDEEDPLNPEPKIDWSGTVAKKLEATGWSVYYSPTDKAIIGKVKIKNNGPDMVDTHILEMQVIPKGKMPFTAFIGKQETCDPDYPTNVHKQFMIEAGKEESIDFMVSDKYLEPGKYEIWFLTRHKCYVDLSSDEEAHHDEFQLVPPFESYQKFPEAIEVPGSESLWGKIFGGGDEDEEGDDNSDESNPAKTAYIVGASIMLIGGLISMIAIGPFGLVIAALGILMFALQNRIFG